MPTKYNREDFREHVTEERPYLRVSREPSPPVAQKLRKPGFMLLVTLSAIIVVLVLGNSMAKVAEFYGQPEREGKGIIVSKEIDDAGTSEESFILYVDVLLPEGDPVRREVMADELSFEQFSVGQEVPLVYQESRSGEEIRIVTLFMPVAMEEAEAEGMLQEDE